jgi:histidinol-phosphatase (PHP family)
VLTDYHVHLRPDEDGTAAEEYFTAANAERYREAATERGIAELGVSEHVYRFRQALDVWDQPYWRPWAVDDLDAYCAFVREQTDLRLGIEADFVPGREDRMASLLEQRDWDYVIGSIHLLGEGAVDDAGYDLWDRTADPDAVWRRYFTLLGEAARSGMYDVLAHPDLVAFWGDERPQPEREPEFYWELAMEGIAESNIAVEVSTAGLRTPLGRIYPHPTFLRWCLEAECPVALSSDAHVSDDLGHRYDEALKLLSGLGVTEIAVFDRRQRRLEPIG